MCLDKTLILDFKYLQILSFSPCGQAVLLPHTKFRWNRTIGRWVMAKKWFSRWRPPSSWILKISIFSHVTVIGFNIWCSVPNFIKIGRFLTEIWRLNDFQNGGRPPAWILKICSFCHVAVADIPFCFLIRNFAEIGQSVDESWPKKRISRWRPPPLATGNYMRGRSLNKFATIARISLTDRFPCCLSRGRSFRETADGAWLHDRTLVAIRWCLVRW